MLSEELQAIVESIERFVANEVIPTAGEDEEESRFRRDIYSELGRLGITGLTISPDYDGLSLGYGCYVLVLEKIAYGSAALACSVSVTSLVSTILGRFAPEAIRKKVLPKLASGEWIGGFCLTEPNAGSDASHLISSATFDGSHYTLNGQKIYITHAAEANCFVVMARNGGSDGDGRVSAFFVEAGTPGIQIQKPFKKMGFNSSPTHEVVFENVKVPAAQLIGQSGEGMKVALSGLDAGRVGIAAISVGIAQRALDESVRYAKERSQFGKPIAEQQGLQFMLADMATKVVASRALVTQAAEALDRQQTVSMLAAITKCFATDSCMAVTTDAVQVFGGYGYMREYPVERLMRDAKVMQIVEGTNQIQRVVIARQLLK